MPKTGKSARTTTPAEARLTPSGPMPDAPHAESSAVDWASHPATVTRHPSGHTYVAESYAGDAVADAAALAQDGEPAGLSRVTRALRPAPAFQPPTPRRLAGLCSWAGAVGILGIVMAVWSGVEEMLGAPGWFLPVATVNGVIGVSLTVGAFFAARKAIVPWALLSGATLSLALGILINLYAAQPIQIN